MDAAEQQGKYHIYCYDEKGTYGSPRKFNDIQGIFEFCELNKLSHHAIRVIDPVEDAIVVEIEAGKYLFPDPWLRFNAF